MKRFLIYLLITALVVVCMAVPAFAVDSNGNEFFSPLDYGKIIDSSDSSNIVYLTSTPTDWILTGAFNDIDPKHEWTYSIGKYMGQSIEFFYSGTAINLLMKPWTGDNIGAGFNGTHVQNGHIVDLSYFPDNTVFSGGFDVTIFGDDVGYQAECWFILHFVDSNGLVVDSFYRTIYPEIVNHTHNTVTYRYEPSINLGNLDLPDSVAGLIPVYTLKHLSVNDTYQIIVDYSAPTFEFSMNALEMEAHNNSQLQYTIKAVQELQRQMDEQEQQFDNFVNGSVDSQNPNGSESFDDLKGVEDNLMGNVQNYLDNGIGFFDNAVGVVMGLSNGFQAIKVLMTPVFNLPFANGLILVSVSLGLLGAILGLVSVASSSIHRKSDAEKQNKAFKNGYKAGFTKKNDKG